MSQVAALSCWGEGVSSPMLNILQTKGLNLRTSRSQMNGLIQTKCCFGGLIGNDDAQNVIKKKKRLPPFNMKSCCAVIQNVKIYNI